MRKVLKIIAFILAPIWIVPFIVFLLLVALWEIFDEACDEIFSK